MTDRFDVAARLAEGRPAVDHTQSYVWAAHLLGYQHPDLTVHGSQVRDWYAAEDGLDLRVLDGDCAALWAAVSTAEEALRMQRTELTELGLAWTGSGSDSAAQFLQRHCEAGAAVAAAVRTAAEGCSALRDNLWQMVDAKVAAAVAIDDRSRAERPAWLAAAQVVTTGAGDRPTAEELVEQRVIPYVDNDIRADWVGAMRSAEESIGASYDATTDELRATPAGQFEIPGDLGPPRPPLPDDLGYPTVASVAPAAMSRPADAAPLTASPAAPSDPAPPPTPVSPTVPADRLGGLPPVPAASGFGAPFGDTTSLPAGTGNLGALGRLVTDAIGGLLGSPADRSDDPAFDDPFDDDDPLDGDDAEPGEEPNDSDGEEEPAEEVVDEKPADEVGADDEGSEDTGESPAATEDVANPPSAPEITTPPADTPPADPGTQPDTPGSTPCEIAADELPQAGR